MATQRVSRHFPVLLLSVIPASAWSQSKVERLPVPERYCANEEVEDHLASWSDKKIASILASGPSKSSGVIDTDRLHYKYLPPLIGYHLSYDSGSYTLIVRKVNTPAINLPVIDLPLNGKTVRLTQVANAEKLRDTEVDTGTQKIYGSVVDFSYRFPVPQDVMAELAGMDASSRIKSTTRFHFAFPANPAGFDCSVYLYPREFAAIRKAVEAQAAGHSK